MCHSNLLHGCRGINGDIISLTFDLCDLEYGNQCLAHDTPSHDAYLSVNADKVCFDTF